jgi:uncharacterized ferredoxin-like protein
MEKDVEYGNPYFYLSITYECELCGFQDCIDGWEYDNNEGKLICPHCDSIKTL